MPSRRTRVALRGLIALYGPLVRIEHGERAEGLADPAIFVFNHNNSFESVGVPALLVALRGGRLVHMLIDWMFLELPVVGWIMRQVEPVPVFMKRARWGWREKYRRQQLARSPIDEAVALLERGCSVGIFPEGTRNPDPNRLARPRAGLARLVTRSHVPVVPIGIQFNVRPGAERVPHVGRMTVRVGEPVDLEPERAAAAAGRPWPEVRQAVERRVMSELAGLCGKSWVSVRSAAPSFDSMEVCHDVR